MKISFTEIPDFAVIFTDRIVNKYPQKPNLDPTRMKPNTRN